jgi:hypothetical protein
VSALLAAGLLSCGEPPPTPNLLGHPVKKAERVILDDNIDASDIRQIFDALNEDGQLEGLAPWVRDASNDELNTLGRIITRYIYQPAQDSNGLVAVLGDRVHRRAFSAAHTASTDFSRQADNKALSDLIEQVLRSKRFVDIVERDIGFLSPALDESLEDLHQELEKAWSKVECDPPLTPPTSLRTVDDATRLLAVPGLKNRFVKLCDALTDSWPIVGLLQSVRQVNQSHGGHAFDGMGAGLARMIREPRHTSSGETQFDSLMELIRALEGPSNGLFSAVQEKLEQDPDLIREFGAILQPKAKLRIGPYVPFLPNSTTAMLVTLLESKASPVAREDWLALAGGGASAEYKNGFFQFFKAARTAHENLIGPPRDEGEDDYLIFNLPLYMNSFVLSTWISQVLADNRLAVTGLTVDHFSEKLLSTKMSTKGFVWNLTDVPPIGPTTFVPARMKEVSDFGLVAFTEALTTAGPNGMGGFQYSIGEMKDVTFREALRQAMEAIDTTRGYADGSAVLRAGVATLTRRSIGGKSLLESFEAPDLLLSMHRTLASIDVRSWRHIRNVLFDGVHIAGWSDDTRKTILGLFESKPGVSQRVERILDSMGVLKNLDSSGKDSASAFEAYLEIVHESGPKEWRALSDAWLFIADSGLFSMQKGRSGSLEPRFSTAHGWLSSGNASGLLRLASELQPARYRPVADFLHDVIRLRDGVKGSDLHWDFFQEIVQQSPRGVAALLDSFRGGSLSSAREKLTVGERDWIVRFVQNGSFRELWKIISPRMGKEGPSKWVAQVRKFQKEGSLASVFRLMGLVKNDRIKAIAKMLQEWEKSGELTAFLDALDSFVVAAGPKPAT